jgi:hypothetical protein
MLERHRVLQRAKIRPGSTVLEVGAGPHAISTVPIAFELGESGRVIATERARWTRFRSIVAKCDVTGQVRAISCDARRLPLRDDSIDLAVCIHGLRSLRTEENIVRVFREMFRVAPKVFVAESLPVARTDAQRAHLAMYNLREPVLEATTGHRDDIPYLPLDRVCLLVARAGGKVEEAKMEDVDLPHALAYFPRTLVESIPMKEVRDRLLLRWDEANAQLQRYGEDHPPVGMVSARRLS